MADPSSEYIPRYDYTIRPVTRSPSRRNPTFTTHQSRADDIERGLQKYGHRIWGFVIYRSTYRDDDEWAACLQTIRSAMAHTLDIYGGLDMLECNPFTVIDDRDLLADASTGTVREHFKNWIVTAPQQEQGTSKGADAWVGSPRYRFCVQIDEGCLRSILDDVHRVEMSEGVFKLIRASWQADDEAELESANSEEVLERHPEIEGCTAFDVGWTNVRQNELLTIYCDFQNRVIWDARYVRPPLVARAHTV